MKKFLSLVLVFAMLCSLIVINVSAAEVSVWDGSASEYLKGSGTKDDPYLIQSAADLKYFADTTNTTEYGAKYAGKYIVQTVDIDLNNITWTPISWKAENSFCGVYDGQGHTISNMKIDQNLAGGPCLALFGYIGRGHGSITLAADCGVANLNLTGTVTMGQARVAGIVGQINSDAHVNNTHKVYLTNIVSDVDITIADYGTDSIWGGVAGYVASAVFENVVNNGTISLTGATSCYIPLGGIAGRAEHVDMIGCVNNGDISFVTTKTNNSLRVGGIVGQIYKKNVNQVQNFINCVNNGDIVANMTVESSNKVFAGGIFGGAWYNVSSSAAYDTWTDGTTKWSNFKTTFAGCVNTGSVSAVKTAASGNTNAGGIAGSCYTTQSKGNNNGGWTFESCVNTGVITATDTGRCAGITQGMWHTENSYHFNNYIKNCATSASLDDNSKKIYAAMAMTSADRTTNLVNNVANDATATAYVDTFSKVLPSTIDINGFNTGVDTSVWTGGASAFFFGSGTAADPYLIRNANDLKALANMVNGTVETSGNNGYNINYVNTFDGKYIKQTADIDLNNIEWLPIGFRETAVFQGVYDGDGHTVSGLKITAISYRTGLFGGVGYVKSHQATQTNAVPTADCGIANLTVNGNVTLAATGHGDRFYVGGVVSFLGDEKLDCDYKAYLTNVTSNVNLTISGFNGGAAFGGVVGHAHNAVLENVVNKGTVNVTAGHCKNHTAGVVAYANSVTFKNCVNNGTVSATTSANNDHLRVGGIVGSYVKNNINNYLTFTNCANTGNVTVTSSNEAPSITLAGGILGGLWYNIGGSYAADTWTDGTTAWADFKITFTNCTNTGVVSAYTTAKAASKASAGGILSTGYAGAGKQYNNGGFLFDNCVNVGTVNCTDADRASGIVGNLYTSGAAAFDTELISCATAADLGIGSKQPTFYNIGADVKNAILNTADADKASSFSSANAADFAAWNLKLVAPSTTNINGMPTAAKVAVLTGVKNEVVELPYAVPATMIVVDANGNKVTNITTAGNYTVKLALVQVTPYVTAEYALKYTIAYENDFLTDDADLLVANFGAVIRHFAKDFNNFSTYGKTKAVVADITYGGILPQDLNKVLTMTIVDGEETLLTFDYSLVTYSFNQLDKTAEELGISLEAKEALDLFLIDKLKYAAVVQGMKGQTENLATEGLTPEQLALGSTFSTIGLDNIKGVTNVVDNDVLRWTAAALVYNDNVSIRLRFATEADLANYEFKVFVAGKEYTDFEVKGACIDVKGFTPTMYADVVTAYLVDAEGNQVSETVSYSVNSYIVNKCNDAVDGPLVQALACYAASAQKYLASVN